MASNAEFWAAIDEQLELLRRKGTTAKIACEILPPIPGLSDSAADGFFAGSGGETQVSEVLNENGWTWIWIKAHYHWCMQAPDGSRLEYVEGDLYQRA